MTLVMTERLKESFRNKLLEEVINASIQQARFDLAICLWEYFEPIMVYGCSSVASAVISSIEETAQLF
jgi:hypothetical protein